MNETAERQQRDASHGPSITFGFESSWSKLEAIRDEWDALVEQTESHIYLTFDWCRTWWAHYGTGRELAVFVVRSDQALVGLVPLFLDRVRLGPVSLRIAKTLCSDHALSFGDLPVRAAFAPLVYREVLKELGDHAQCDLVAFSGLSSSYSQLELLRGAVEESEQFRTFETGREVTHTVFHLEGTFDDYLKTLSSNQRKKYRRSTKKLAKSFEIEHDVLCHGPDVMREFERFQTMHADQWSRQGKLGHFGDWPNATQYHRDLMRVAMTTSRARLMRMFAEGEVVSYNYCYVFGSRCYWLLPARIMGEPWDRFALGRISLFNTIERAYEEGLTSVEGGRGDYTYKTEAGATPYPLRSVMAVSNRFAAGVRAHAFGKLADALNLAYYRAWYSRFAPQLGLAARPLIKSWLRSRL